MRLLKVAFLGVIINVVSAEWHIYDNQFDPLDFDNYEDPDSLLYFLIVQHISSKTERDAFRAAPQNSSYENAKLFIHKLEKIGLDRPLRLSDAFERRLAVPSFPGCDIYACPPGPCAVYDIDYLSAFTYDHVNHAFNFRSTGRCGPAFNVQLVDKNTYPYEFYPAQVAENVRRYFPDINTEGDDIFVYNPMSVHQIPVNGLVPSVGNLNNRNPPSYYTSPLAHDTGTDIEDYHKNLDCEVFTKTPVKWPKSPFVGIQISTSPLMTDIKRMKQMGDFTVGSNAAQTVWENYKKNGDDEFIDLIPQTFQHGTESELNSNFDEFLRAQEDAYKDTCDLSQCRILPRVKRQDYASFATSLNCFFLEVLNDAFPNIADDKKFARSGFDSNSVKWETSCYPAHDDVNYRNTSFADLSDNYRFVYPAVANSPKYGYGLMHKVLDHTYSGSEDEYSWKKRPFNDFSLNHLSNALGTTEGHNPNEPFWNFLSLPKHSDWGCVNPKHAPSIFTYGLQTTNIIKNAFRVVFGSTLDKQTLLGSCFHGNVDADKSSMQCLYDLAANLKSHEGDYLKHTKIAKATGIVADVLKQHQKKYDDWDWVEKLRDQDAETHSYVYWIWASVLFDIVHIQETDIPDELQRYMGSMIAEDFNGVREKPVGEHSRYQPLQAAITGWPDRLPRERLMLNASVLNSYTKSESAACNCGNERIEYAYLNLPWSAVSQGNSENEPLYVEIAKSFDIPSEDDLSYGSTVVRQSSYSWHAPADGDFRDGLPIGLYIPSSRRFGRNFVTIERDFLNPNSKYAGPHSPKHLATMYYAGSNKPDSDTLANNLRFNSGELSDFQNHPHRTRRLTYKYGACMKPPYGHYSTFELSETAFSTLYPNCNFNDDECIVQEESLIGYCEKIDSIYGDATEEDKRYGYCVDDPLSFRERKKLCEHPRASNIALTQTLGVRSPANICNKVSKVCLVIPGEPGVSLNAILNTPDLYGDVTGYTMLVTPFNHTVALSLVGPNCFMYKTGTLVMIPIDTPKSFLGVQPLTQDEFKLLYDQSDDVETIISNVDNIVAKLKDKSGEQFDMPFITNFPSSQITEDFLFPRHQLSSVAVNHADVTIKSASTTNPLRFMPHEVLPVSRPVPCTLFYVGARNFRISAASADFTTCRFKSGMDAAAIVFGSEDVSHSHVEISVTGTSEPAVVFAGGDIKHFPMFPIVEATDVNIVLPLYNDSHSFAVAAAKTHGNIILRCPLMDNNKSMVHVLVQPATSTTNNQDKTLTWAFHGDDAQPTIVDVSKYTQVFGNNVLELAYPQTHAKEHFHLAVFIFSVATITFITALFIYRWIDYFLYYIHEGNYDEGVQVHTTLFGQIIKFDGGARVESVSDYASKMGRAQSTTMVDAAIAHNTQDGF